MLVLEGSLDRRPILGEIVGGDVGAVFLEVARDAAGQGSRVEGGRAIGGERL